MEKPTDWGYDYYKELEQKIWDQAPNREDKEILMERARATYEHVVVQDIEQAISDTIKK